MFKTLFRVVPQLNYYSTAANQSSKQICIVGSGPAGFYFAQHILKQEPNASVDLYEKLPVPFGLVRYGVAPDHPEVKNVINTFTKTAQNPRFRFIGNVTVGKHVTFEELKNAYHAVVFTYGCNEDRALNIKGENLKNVVSARQFVGWYNGDPEDVDFLPDLNTETAIILGQGNVAVDVARILLTPIDILKKTDITSYALEHISKSKIKTVYLVGRRGPLQVAFTIKEFREMTKLPGVSIKFRENQLDGLEPLLSDLPRARKRLTELLLKTSQSPQKGDRIFYPLFLRKPISILGGDQATGVKFSVNKIIDQDKGIVESTDQTEDINGGLVLRSIGYKGTCPDSSIPFDSNAGVVTCIPGVYSAGWINSGPVGVILSTMSNAFSQAERLYQDIKAGVVDVSSPKPGFEAVRNIIRQKNSPIVTFEGWEKINSEEVNRGKELGKPREKIVDIQEMVRIGGSAP